MKTLVICLLLATDIYRDDAVSKAPVVLMRTPYDRTKAKGNAEKFAEAGYIAVMQDCRGTRASAGVTATYNTEGQDGYDTIVVDHTPAMVQWACRHGWQLMCRRSAVAGGSRATSGARGIPSAGGPRPQRPRNCGDARKSQRPGSGVAAAVGTAALR